MKRLQSFIMSGGLLVSSLILQLPPCQAGTFDHQASLFAEENTERAAGGKSLCRIERPLVAYMDPDTKIVRRIPAVIPPPRCLNVDAQRQHEQSNTVLQRLHDLYGQKKQPVRKVRNDTDGSGHYEASQAAASDLSPAGILLPRLSPETFATMSSDPHMVLAMAGGNYMNLLSQAPSISQTGRRHETALKVSAEGGLSALPFEVHAAYDAVNQTMQFNSVTPNVSHDANGNLTSLTDATGTTTFTYDARNRLIARNGPGINETYIYDALGRRMAKATNNVTKNYLYADNDMAAEVQNGTVTATYLHGQQIDEPFVRQASNGNEYYLTNDLGSTLALTDDAGAVTTRYHYGPFGETSATGAASDNPFQFTGREHDDHELYYYRARYYHPRLQRFLSEDPLDVSEVILRGQAGQADGSNSQDVSVLRSTLLSNPQFLNRYAYALNNPVNFTDPTGEIIVQTVACGIGAGISISSDVLGSRKPNLVNAGLGCLTAAAGLRLTAELPRLYPPLFHALNHNRYFRIGLGKIDGNMVPRVSLGSRPGGPHSRLWP